jgi:hypothetical protein
MAGEADPILLTAGDATASNSKVASGVESDTAPVSSSSSAAMCTIMKKDISTLQAY